MKKVLFLIFLVALFLRFLYFPGNIYFGYDQARDAFESQNIYKNFDLKIIGPSTAMENLFHGPLYWYLIGPLYLFGNGNPIFPAALLLLINAVGVFIIFWLGKTLFNNKVGILASFIYAFSFEQTQYAMYFGNPAAAVLTIMLFYGGMSALIFKKRWLGLPVALIGLGLSVQFEFFLIYLGTVFIILLFVFRDSINKVLNLKQVSVSVFLFLLVTAPFLLAEIKFGFRTIRTLLRILGKVGINEQSSNNVITSYLDKLILRVNDNIVSSSVQNYSLTKIIFFVLVFSALYLFLKKKEDYRKLIFLLIWMFSSILFLVFGGGNLYYTYLGISPAFILLTSFLIYLLSKRFFFLSLVLTLAILFSNIKLIVNQNPKGIISGIYVQEGMLLSREKKVIDYIYMEAVGKPIVVSALTMPLKINTTWAYLFNWYGKEKYGYLPYWAGETALGYPGDLPRWQSQVEDYIMFSIIEPTRGIRYAFVENFLTEQEQYGKVVDEKIFGDNAYTQLVVQKRESLK